MEIISQGAEAIIIKEKNNVLKKRIKKSYRIQEIDERLRKTRTRRETKILKRARDLIPVPKILDFCDKDMTIKMEFIDGLKLSEALDSLKNKYEIAELIGKQIAILHNNNIIHGDLTTSNMLLKKDKLYFIDFGLSYIDEKTEHKAVDLHLIKQALESKHYLYFEDLFKSVLKGYRNNSNNYEAIMQRLLSVESRGRYKRKKVTN